MMSSARSAKKPAQLAPTHNRNILFNELLDILPGWVDSTFASGKRFTELLCAVLWKVLVIIYLYSLHYNTITEMPLDLSPNTNTVNYYIGKC